MTNHPNRKSMTVNIVDPDWDDLTPVSITGANKPDAFRKFWSSYYDDAVERRPLPDFYVAPERGVGTGAFGSIGDTRIVRFTIIDRKGRRFSVYY